jgi:hypothetical protein
LLLPNRLGSISVGAASAHDYEPVEAYEGWKDFKPGAPFIESEIRSSANGELSTTPRMQYTYKTIGGYRLVRTYEGTVPGPTPEPIWLDTPIVPRNGSITFQSRFLDLTGKYMLHCHMMNHEDLGMMPGGWGLCRQLVAAFTPSHVR